MSLPPPYRSCIQRGSVLGKCVRRYEIVSADFSMGHDHARSANSVLGGPYASDLYDDVTTLGGLGTPVLSCNNRR